MLSLLFVPLVLWGCMTGPATCKPIPRFRQARGVRNLRQDLISECKEQWRDAVLDHFTWDKADKKGPITFKQRYFVCSNHWGVDDDGQLGPILFYLGNEADVTLYLNASGLMWESAPSFRAMLVFAEHRYYGKSAPFGSDVRKHMQYLSAEQAMADYAELIQELKQQYNASDAPVIGFGGSYGGMLASWFRMKYPHVLDGAVAASAPIWSFMGETPPVDPAYFSKGVTWDASAGGGSHPACAASVRRAWSLFLTLGATQEGRSTLARSIGLCPKVKLTSWDDVYELRDWLASAWDYMAMGNFPYPSGYILNGHGELPAFPVREACKHLTKSDFKDEELLAAVGQAAGVYYNYTQDLKCFDFKAGVNPDSDADANFWDYQYCTEMFMPFGKDGEADMFWSEPWNATAAAQACFDNWGVWPRMTWAQTEWGGKRIGSASRIVFTNGLLDPWHGGGVLRDVNDDVTALIIPEGAHHLDLMFSHPDDPASVIEVRRQQRRLITKWIKLARLEQRQQREQQEGVLQAGRGAAGGVLGRPMLKDSQVM